MDTVRGIDEVQQAFLDSLICERLTDAEENRVLTRKIRMKRNEGLVDILCSDESWDRDAAKTTACYVVKTKGKKVLFFFSLRCGELFDRVDDALLDFADEAYREIYTVAHHLAPSEEEPERAKAYWEKAQQKGLSLGDLEVLHQKKLLYKSDIHIETSNEINRVLNIYPAIELSLLGVNEEEKEWWQSMGMPRKMGETLFWHFVVPKLEEILAHVGCQYLYLFAADQEPDGALVNYYRVRLFFDIPTALGANKPRFDYQCQFMCQEIPKLIDQRNLFFAHFNADFAQDT